MGLALTIKIIEWYVFFHYTHGKSLKFFNQFQQYFGEERKIVKKSGYHVA